MEFSGNTYKFNYLTPRYAGLKHVARKCEKNDDVHLSLLKGNHS